MTKSYSDIQKQIQALQREADKLKRKEVEGVIARIKEAIEVYGLTAADLGLSVRAGRPGATPGRKAAAPARRKRADAEVKYRDEAGNVWGGRGPRPRWLRDALAGGKSLGDFAV